MFKIKRLYIFIIQTFFPVFIMTFGICLFIVLMQFIWRYVEDFVGKGLDNAVLAELFLYAALQLVPMALPLSLLLASLMAFGNLGERLELLAIKASGVSLLKTMRPLIILVSLIAIGGFFYQNEAMPRIQVKLRALLISIRQKSPELDIPEGSFYSVIKDYSLYVKKKDPKTKMLKDVMIYDTSKGFDNMSVFVCDSGIMNTSEDKKNLVLTLYDGQRFANFQQGDLNNTSSKRSGSNQFVPYSRENFKEKKIIIPFNTGFDRMDEANLEGTQISKNIEQLTLSIDSMSTRLDSLNINDRKIIGKHTFLSYRANDAYYKNIEAKKEEDKSDSDKKTEKDEKPVNRIEFDSLLQTFSRDEIGQYVSTAYSQSENSNFNIIETTQKINLRKNIRYHEIERHQKFTLSFACLIFFFIGAPLGAIIRKGGLGMPVVVSVCLFIIYYIVNNIGYKMARDAVWEVWQGMWLSSAVLFPLGVFLTYKAMNDSTLFNPEAYSKYLRKILRLGTKASSGEALDVDPDDVKSLYELDVDLELVKTLSSLNSSVLKDIIKNYQQHNYDKSVQSVAMAILKERGESFWGVQIKNLDYEAVKKYYKEFRWNGIAVFALYLFLYMIPFMYKDILLIVAMNIIYLVCFARIFICYSDFYNIIDKKINNRTSGLRLLGLFLLPIFFYPYIMKEMKKDIDSVR